jgi:hypothetical protein
MLLAGNLLIVDQEPGQLKYYLMVYNQSGALISSQVIPQPPGQTGYQGTTGVTVDSTGKFDVVNAGLPGANQPYLSTYSPATGTWTQQTYPGWPVDGGTDTNGTDGSLGNYVYVSDLGTTIPQGTRYGILRFDTTGGPTVAFAPNETFGQVAVGLDGLIYGLDTTSVPFHSEVLAYDPKTLNLVKSVTIPYLTNINDDWRSLAVDASGEIFLADWDGNVVKMSPGGSIVAKQYVANS